MGRQRQNPYENPIPATVKAGGFLMFRFRGTVFTSVWWQVLLVILYSAGIVFLEFDFPSLYLNFPDTLIDILGIVTSLLLCFRTDSAFERYTEGREIWSKITSSIRSMTKEIWLGVREQSAKDVIEKRSALNLLVAFVIATKHYLREEYSSDYLDVQELISHLPRFHTPSSVQSLKQNKILNKYSAHDLVTPTNIPIEITYYLEGYFRSISRRELANENSIDAMGEGLNSLVECLCSFERIQRTPIPLAYSVHLHHCVWIFILSLPYQMIGTMGWWTVPGVGLAAFSLLGILAIGWEIENPFGYDANDLPLDDFCEVIREEINMITRTRIADPEEWIYSEDNHPLAPRIRMSAKQLLAADIPLNSLRNLIRN